MKTGRLLMWVGYMEDIAVAKGCNSIELNTFGFQAPGFYEKQAHKLCGVYENVPKGYNRYFFVKYLSKHKG